ncbi:GatB/YqeY domain-containing protein [Limibacillus sp. MBR-115]|jgi:uncharacterized protein YqeY|uniref:GatB/YqeY domain-containing protein n=1 Tax=Limibacillus sp. MBR-115 TaxID=3156465 RepID=UPI003390D3ED
MLRSDLSEALKQALKQKEQTATSTLRLILAALKDRDIAARSKGQMEGIEEAEILEMLQKMIKQREESITAFDKGGRPDLVEKERAEIEVIRRFLPQGLSEAESQTVIDETIAELEAASIKDMGRVMALLKERYPGRMDFSLASRLVKERLA